VKYIGCWVLSLSWTSAELMAFLDAAMYITSGRERSGLVKIGGGGGEELLQSVEILFAGVVPGKLCRLLQKLDHWFDFVR